MAGYRIEMNYSHRLKNKVLRTRIVKYMVAISVKPQTPMPRPFVDAFAS
jgi:hypothetical protein